jgi:ubiquinone/menaquinone biosynthesis C-methylase UbiE
VTRDTKEIRIVADSVDLYDTTYSNLDMTAHEQVRLETYGEDLGQSSWLTADELRRFITWLNLTPSSHVLEVGSGSGGPALFAVELTGARVTGIDINEHAIAAGTKMAHDRGLEGQTHFLQVDAGLPLPFPDGTFDAIICIDAVIHLPDRPHVLAEWHRVLKSGGRALFTDTTVVTGLLTKEEIATRSSIGYFVFAPPGEDERLLKEAGFEVERVEDVTENAAVVARRWCEARARHREALLRVEDEATYEGLQQFLTTVGLVSAERRLSRFVFVARKPHT